MSLTKIKVSSYLKIDQACAVEILESLHRRGLQVNMFDSTRKTLKVCNLSGDCDRELHHTEFKTDDIESHRKWRRDKDIHQLLQSKPDVKRPIVPRLEYSYSCENKKTETLHFFALITTPKFTLQELIDKQGYITLEQFGDIKRLLIDLGRGDLGEGPDRSFEFVHGNVNPNVLWCMDGKRDWRILGFQNAVLVHDKDFIKQAANIPVCSGFGTTSLTLADIYTTTKKGSHVKEYQAELMHDAFRRKINLYQFYYWLVEINANRKLVCSVSRLVS